MEVRNALEIWDLSATAQFARRALSPYDGDQVAAADLDGDGDAGLLLAHNSAGEILVMGADCG